MTPSILAKAEVMKARSMGCAEVMNLDGRSVAIIPLPNKRYRIDGREMDERAAIALVTIYLIGEEN